MASEPAPATAARTPGSPPVRAGSAAGESFTPRSDRLHPYWQAAAFAETILADFDAGRRAGQPAVARAHFYVLANYFRRTLRILHGAFAERDELLALAALRNVAVLQHSLATMHRADPDAAPTSLALDPLLHRRINRDLVQRLLRDATRPLDVEDVVRRFNELDVLADARRPAVLAALRALVATGHATEHDGRFRLTDLPYVDADVERASLAMLVGDELAERLGEAGFEGLAEALDRPDEFRAAFVAATGFGAAAASLVLACADALETPIHDLAPEGRWPHAGLASSPWPRPYQRLIQAIFRAQRYHGQVVEAPNGSGKTMIGMLCIDDWLRELAPGQSILVLVPTVNYQQQWLGELCLKAIGLRLPPHAVYAGTPGGLTALRQRTGSLPAVIVTTYPALARMIAGAGRGGYSRAALERFLQGANVRHIILDEVHKAAVDLSSPTAECVRILVDWLRDGSLSSLIGFSGTLLELEAELRSLGLEVAYVLPPAELIGQGWVAPFSELGVPFNWSDRERRIAELLDRYRDRLREYLATLGERRLRNWFAAVPLADRVAIALRLGMYAGEPDAEARVRERLAAGETGGEIGLDELHLPLIVQAAHRWSDATMAEEAGRGDRVAAWTAAFDEIRQALRPLLPPGQVRRRLDAPAFGMAVAGGILAGDAAGGATRRLAARLARDELAATFIGLYLGLRDWSRQAGEGRVEAVRSVIAVERAARRVSGIIVFDNPAPLDWLNGPASPGYRGAAGLYLQLLEDADALPVAALATELYLPDRRVPSPAGEGRLLHEAIAGWVLEEMIRRELGESLHALLVASAPAGAEAAARLRVVLDAALERYVVGLASPSDDHPIDRFDHAVLAPLRALVRQERRASPLRRLAPLLSAERRHPHMRSIARAVLDYGQLASAFRSATLAQAVRADGTPCAVRVVPMPSGDRRQRMYDLVGRMVDSPDLPIDLVVVSSWARTGWNVTTPNVLVDATATRDVIAWQQLRGRAMRPWPGWTADEQRQVQALLAEPGQDVGPASSGPEASGTDSAPRAGQTRTERDRRERAAVDVLLSRNKVAHIYELIRGYGGAAQVRRHPGGGWERTDAIAAKHRREWSVRACDGAHLAGPEHAPLMIAVDPRTDTPAMLRRRLAAELATGDEATVRGWLRAAASRQAARPGATG